MFFNDEKALIVFFLSYYFGVHQVIVSFKKDKNFLWGVLRTSNAWRIFEVFTLFYFSHISKHCFRIKLYLKQTLPLMSSWPPRAKFVDDLALLEIVPRNSPPVMNFLLEDIHQYANSHNMRLNPKNVIQWRLTFLSITAACGVPLLSATRS